MRINKDNDLIPPEDIAKKHNLWLPTIPHINVLNALEEYAFQEVDAVLTKAHAAHKIVIDKYDEDLKQANKEIELLKHSMDILNKALSISTKESIDLEHEIKSRDQMCKDMAKVITLMYNRFEGIAGYGHEDDIEAINRAKEMINQYNKLCKK